MIDTKSIEITRNLRKELKICDECGGTLIRQNCFLVCVQCGLEHEFEEEYFVKQFTTDNPAFKYRNKNLPQAEFHKSIQFVHKGTVMGYLSGSKDYLNALHNIPITNKEKFERLRQLDMQTVGREGTVYRALSILRNFTGLFDMPLRIQQEIAHMFQKKRKKYNIINHISLIFTCMALVYLKNQIPIPIIEIIRMARIYGHKYNFQMYVRDRKEYFSEYRTLSIQDRDYLARYLMLFRSDLFLQNQLQIRNIPNEAFFQYIEQIARWLFLNKKKVTMRGVRPMNFAIGSIYAAIRIFDLYSQMAHFVSQARLAKCMESTEASVRDTYKYYFKPFLVKHYEFFTTPIFLNQSGEKTNVESSINTRDLD